MIRFSVGAMALLLVWAAAIDAGDARRACEARHSPATCLHIMRG